MKNILPVLATAAVLILAGCTTRSTVADTKPAPAVAVVAATPATNAHAPPPPPHRIHHAANLFGCG